MPCVSYYSNGFAREPTVQNRRFGMGEIRFYNPTLHDTNIDVTLFYENQPPRQYPRQTLKARCNKLLLVFPSQNPTYFPESGVYGAKIVSDEFITVDHILAAGVEPPPLADKPKTVMQILPDSTPFFLADFKDGFLQAFALADISNGARYKHALFRIQRTETDLHRKLVSVLVQAVEL